MTFRTLIRRSLHFHWRSHLGVVLGAAIGSAALIGALVVGDSVRESLRQQALRRLGSIQFALQAGDRTFTDQLAARMPSDLKDSWREDEGDTWVYFGGGPAAALVLPAVAIRPDDGARANHVQVIGVVQVPEGERGNHYYELWSYANWRDTPGLAAGQVLLNAALATQLQAKLGDQIIFRVQKPGALSPDMAISPRNDHSASLRLQVAGIVPSEELGNFSLRVTATPVLNAFINLEELQKVTGLRGRANVMVSGGIEVNPERVPGKVHDSVQPVAAKRIAEIAARQVRLIRERDSATATQEFQEALREMAVLSDYEAEARIQSALHCVDLVARRVFLDSPIVRSASSSATNLIQSWPDEVNSPGVPLLTYLVTLLQAGTNATPYSMVTAVGAPWTPADMRDDEIIVSQWLADDLRVKPGDEIALTYFDPESGARLTERTNTFRVRSIVPMEMPWADRTLMPDFPGIEKAESTSDWDAGFPLVHKIRQKDEVYWKQYRGTPKAFVTLTAGQKMWGNRFGNLTAIRFLIPKDSTNSLNEFRAALEKKILAHLKPEELGLRFEPVREQALKAAKESQDFGGLFLGFSLFLITAALLLMAMLFRLGLEQRAPEVGTLLALGFTPRQVRWMLIWESVVLSLVGGVLGALCGLAYARAMLHGLMTIWRDAVGTSVLSFHVTTQTLVVGLFASTVVCVAAIWLVFRRFVKRSARELLAGELESPRDKKRSLGKFIGIGTLVCAAGTVGWAVASGQTANAETFFSAGALFLIAGLAFGSAWLTRMASNVTESGPQSDVKQTVQASLTAGLSLSSLGIRGCARRRSRSLTTVAMLACGSFLIVSIGVFRLDANRDAWKRNSGTGGFALIGETTMPVVQDLNSQSGRDFFALSGRAIEGVSFVPFRVREGDEASCLNLNAAQRPRLLGVKPELLEARFSFAKGEDWKSLISARFQPSESGPPSSENRLSGLPASQTDNTGLKLGANEIEIPAIGDAASIQWAMHKKIGETIDYVDERGQPFKVRIVGALANSILQGQLLIDEAEFVKRFPGESGYRMFLIDAPSNRVVEVSATLSRAMQDVGLELTPAAQRLAQFNAVQNTYLGTFQVLGALGLLLGSVGLGIVVLRNVLERRGELAVLLAVGFRRPTLQRLLLIENGSLLTLGLALGVVAAAVAVLPALLSPSAELPVTSLVLTLGAVLVNGALWTWAATRLALRGDLLAALRNE